nr:HVA22-like protein k isoform X2 [Ipomoea trifida]
MRLHYGMVSAAVLLVLFYLFILHLRQLNEGIKRSKKNGLCTGQFVVCSFLCVSLRTNEDSLLLAAYGSFSMVELFTDKLLNWFPLYYHTKFAFLVWLQLPSIDGAKQVYMNHLRPFLLGHQAKLDQIVGFVYGEMSRFVSQHLEEVMFVKTILMKILASGEDNTRPEQRQASAAIEGPNTEDDSESECSTFSTEVNNDSLAECRDPLDVMICSSMFYPRLSTSPAIEGPNREIIQNPRMMIE